MAFGAKYSGGSVHDLHEIATDRSPHLNFNVFEFQHEHVLVTNDASLVAATTLFCTDRR